MIAILHPTTLNGIKRHGPRSSGWSQLHDPRVTYVAKDPKCPRGSVYLFATLADVPS